MGEPKPPPRSTSLTPPLELLTRVERFAFRCVSFFNRGPGRAAAAVWQRFLLEPILWLLIGRRLSMHGLDRLREVPPGAPLLLVANHRSFFDLFVLSYLVRNTPGQRREASFPVRANFFYDNLVGLALALLGSGGAMFPPFFRSAGKRLFNVHSLAILIAKLREPGQLIGFHPEGTRSTGDDPYQLLPAQPGAGELALKARPVVLPAFVSGLSNNLASELWSNLRRRRPIVVVFGAPADLSAFPEEGTRLSHHKRCADLLLEQIRALGEEERAIRLKLA